MFKILRPCLLLAAAFVVLQAVPAFAKTYHCEGQIQYRPCDVPMHTPKRPVYVPNRTSFRRYSPAFEKLGNFSNPHVVNTTFKRLANGEGIWRGFVGGVGKVSLALQIKEAGKAVNHYSIGELEILPSEAPVRFTYKSVAPRGEQWTWKVIAKSRQG